MWSPRGPYREPGQVPGLLQHWNDVRSRLSSTGLLALFLDFDGTLVPFASRPEGVILDSGVRDNLELLAKNPRVRLCIMSGRRRDDVLSRTGVDGIEFLGLHGWEGRGTAPPLRETSLRALAELKAQLASKFTSKTGVWVEDKGVTLAVHYRQTARRYIAPARKAVYEAVSAAAAHFTVVNSHRVWEIFAEGMENKGDAVHAELAQLPQTALPLYLGDDRADEPAFSAAAAGITARVGRPIRTCAKYRLASVRQVHEFLRRLILEVS